MFENKVVHGVVSAYFIAVSVLMYYFITQMVIIGVGFSYRHLFALLIIFSAFICFMIKPDIARARVSVRSSLVFSVPLLVVLVSSMFIWLYYQSDIRVINRGLSGCLCYNNWFSAALAAGALLYIFGEKGIWYNLGAMLISNIIFIGAIFVEDGIGPYMSEFSELLLSFADNTGDVIVKAELHELAFGTGAYLLFMLLRPKKKAWFWALFAVAAFCFLSALKRIAVFALVFALLFGIILKLLKKISPKLASGAITVTTVFIIVILIAYIAAVRGGVFEMLEKAGIDTSARADIYSHVEQYYDFSPLYIGKGIGFLTFQLNELISIGVTAVHNDFLQFYIDLGFVGYILFLISMTLVRFRYFGRQERCDAEINTFVMILYLFIVSSTDNTMNYPLITTVLAMIIMGYGYDSEVRAVREGITLAEADRMEECK